eukprot:371475-Prorocentrum_minimum.AAC.1
MRTENRLIGGQGCSGESTPLNNGSCKVGSSDGPMREGITMDGPKRGAEGCSGRARHVCCVAN